MGIVDINLIKYSTNTTTLNIKINIDVFNAKKYNYIISYHQDTTNNKLTVQKIIMEKFKEFKIIDDNVLIDIIELNDLKYI